MTRTDAARAAGREPLTRLALLVLAAGLLAGCGTVAAVRPLRRGESAFSLGLGGPVARVAGADIPLPYTVARYRYGLTDHASAWAGGHLLMAAFGVLGLEGGMSYHFLRPHGLVPTLGVAASGIALVRPGGSARLLPGLDAIATWQAGRRLLVYTGVQSLYQFRRPPVVFAPLVGLEFRPGPSLALSLETKWYAPIEPARPRNVDFRLPIGGRGAVGFTIGASYLPGGWP